MQQTAPPLPLSPADIIATAAAPASPSVAGGDIPQRRVVRRVVHRPGYGPGHAMTPARARASSTAADAAAATPQRHQSSALTSPAVTPRAPLVLLRGAELQHHHRSDSEHEDEDDAAAAEKQQRHPLLARRDSDATTQCSDGEHRGHGAATFVTGSASSSHASTAAYSSNNNASSSRSSGGDATPPLHLHQQQQQQPPQQCYGNNSLCRQHGNGGFTTHTASSVPPFYGRGAHQQHHHEQQMMSAFYRGVAHRVAHPLHFHAAAVADVKAFVGRSAPAAGRSHPAAAAATAVPPQPWMSPVLAAQRLPAQRTVRSNAYARSLHKVALDMGLPLLPWPSLALFQDAVLGGGNGQQQQQWQFDPSTATTTVLHVGGLPAKATRGQVLTLLCALTGGRCRPAPHGAVLDVELVGSQNGGESHSAVVTLSDRGVAELCVRRINRRVLLDEAGFIYAGRADHLELLTLYVDQLRYFDDMRYQSRPHSTLSVSIVATGAAAPTDEQQHQHDDHHPLCPCCAAADARIAAATAAVERDCAAFVAHYACELAEHYRLDELDPRHDAQLLLHVHSSCYPGNSPPKQASVDDLDRRMRERWPAVLRFGLGAKSCYAFRHGHGDLTAAATAQEWHQFELELAQLQRAIRDGREELNVIRPRFAQQQRQAASTMIFGGPF